MEERISHLIFDIETVPDGRLIQRCKYADRPDLTPEAAVELLRQEILMRSEGRDDFIPPVYQLPVSIAIAKIGPDFRLLDLLTLDRARFRPQVMTRHFWQGWSKYGRPCLVSFNGRGFDLPVLEAAAFRYGIPVPEWFSARGGSNPRNRYNTAASFDLFDYLQNFAGRGGGGLNFWATLLAKPGKMQVQGGMVYDLWQAGQRMEIDDYCLCDVLDTYFVFLRLKLLQGEIDLATERKRVEEAYALLCQKVEAYPGVGRYRSRFQFWEPVGDEVNGFFEGDQT